MGDGARLGDARSAVGRPSHRRILVGVALAAVVLAAVVGSQVFATVLSDYPRGACVTYGYGGAIIDDEATGPPRPSTPEAAIAELATRSPSPLGGDRSPTDGWHEYRGRWVRDTAGGYEEVDLIETARGWSVRSISTCGG